MASREPPAGRPEPAGGHGPARGWRILLLVAGPLLFLIALVAGGPIPQDPAYHRFADGRSWLGIPSFLNVASNLCFLVAGIAGLRAARALPPAPGRQAWLAFFASTALVAAGSAWYHLDPGDGSLVWDRLPMSAGFVAVTLALLAERVASGVERLLWPGIAVGIASVLWWATTGDLRFYGFVQFGPAIVFLLTLLLWPGPRRETAWIMAALACYALAKVAEHFDAGLFVASSEFVSGHTVKHVLAALGAGALVTLLRQRVQRPAGQHRPPP